MKSLNIFLTWYIDGHFVSSPLSDVSGQCSDKKKEELHLLIISY